MRILFILISKEGLQCGQQCAAQVCPKATGSLQTTVYFIWMPSRAMTLGYLDQLSKKHIEAWVRFMHPRGGKSCKDKVHHIREKFKTKLSEVCRNVPSRVQNT